MFAGCVGNGFRGQWIRSVTTYLWKSEQPISNTHVLCMKTSVFLTIHLSLKKVQKDIRAGSEIWALFANVCNLYKKFTFVPKFDLGDTLIEIYWGYL